MTGLHRSRRFQRWMVVLVAGGLASWFAFNGAAPATPGAAASPLGQFAGKKLDLQAEQMNVDLERREARLTGDVSAQLGKLQVGCQSLLIQFDDAPRIQSAQLSGRVRARYRGVELRAEELVLDATTERATFTRGVELRRGETWFKARQATIDLDTGKLNFSEIAGSMPVKPAK